MAQRGRKVDSAVREDYLNWFLTPPTERDPKTKTEKAAELGVTERTLYNWENSDEFQTKAKEIKTKWGTRWHGEILGRLMAVVSEGTDRDAIAAARVLLQHLHVEAESQVHDPTQDQVEAIREVLEGQGYKVIQRDGADG